MLTNQNKLIMAKGEVSEFGPAIPFTLLGEDAFSLALKVVNGKHFYLRTEEVCYCLKICSVKHEDGTGKKFLFEAKVITAKNNEGYDLSVMHDTKCHGYLDAKDNAGHICVIAD